MIAANVKVVEGKDRLSSRPDCAVEASTGPTIFTVATSSNIAPRTTTRIVLGLVSWGLLLQDEFSNPLGILYL